jgi:hypothetical protein
MCPVHERRRRGASLASARQIARERSTRKEIHMKVRSILITGAVFALIVPVAQAAASSKTLVHPSTEIRAMTMRGEALNHKYHLGAYAPAAGIGGFASDVANSSAVARYQANLGNDVTPVSTGDNGVFQSPATDAGIAAGLVLLISAIGFTLTRSRNRPVRPV